MSAAPKTARRAPTVPAAPRTIRITLVRSLIASPEAQRRVARALGLRRLRSSVLRPATPEVLGQVRKISHALAVETVED